MCKKDINTILDSYKTIGRPFRDYFAPVWAEISDSLWKKTPNCTQNDERMSLNDFRRPPTPRQIKI